MIKFDVSSAAEVYPEKLREVRYQLKMSQHEFAEAAGYSTVMQGRYEAKRGTSNSATPSAKTASAIKAMVEARLAKANENASEPAELGVPSKHSLKAFGVMQLEAAIDEALYKLTGTPYGVTVKRQIWGESDQGDAEILLQVSAPA